MPSSHLPSNTPLEGAKGSIGPTILEEVEGPITALRPEAIREWHHPTVDDRSGQKQATRKAPCINERRLPPTDQPVRSELRTDPGLPCIPLETLRIRAMALAMPMTS